MMGQGGSVPILVLKEGTQREKGRGAQSNNIAAARAIADAVKSTLGPRGMDKMLVDSMGDVVITNDGVTILKEIDVEHPAAKMLVEVAKTQDQECGDGTTSAVVITGELLKRSEELVEQNVHPTIITGGFRMAADKATELLEKMAEKVDINDREVLKKIAMTSMASKGGAAYREKLAEIAVRAVTSIAEERDGRFVVDKDSLLVVKKHGGSVGDTELVDGIILDKEVVHANMPKTVKDARIALLDVALEVKKTEVEAKIEITSPDQLQAFLNEEENMLKKKVELIKKSGANVVVCQKGIDDLVQYYLAKEKILAVRRAKESDMKKLARATGGRIVSNLNDLSKEDLGRAGLVEERKIGEDKMTFVTGCPKAKAVSILIRGGTEHVVDELERSLEDATRVVGVAIEDGKILPGGGAVHIELALGLKDYAASVGGREQLAIDAFADALEVVPRTLAENAGLDPINVLIDLRKAHKNRERATGVNVFTGKVEDMKKLSVIEPLRVDRQAIQSATEAAVMILRIDDVIAAKATKGPPAGGAPGGGPGGMGGGGMGGMGDYD
ncbi:MAG: thermosome subunit beta [Thermoplasmatota archaeon]